MPCHVVKHFGSGGREYIHEPQGKCPVCDPDPESTIAALQAQLQEVTEERDRLKRTGVSVSGKLLEAVMVGDQLAKEYDAAIKRGVKVVNYAVAMTELYDDNWHKAEAAERDIASLQEDVGRAEGELARADKERQAAERRVGELEAAGVTDYSELGTGSNRVDCHFCPSVWRSGDPPKHKPTCPLAKAQEGEA